MLLITGTICIPPENLPAAKPVMEQMVQASRAEDGCLHYAYAQDLFDPALIHVSELWRDQTALDAHFASAHLAEWRASWTDLEIGDRKLQLYEVANQRPT